MAVDGVEEQDDVPVSIGGVFFVLFLVILMALPSMMFFFMDDGDGPAVAVVGDTALEAEPTRERIEEKEYNNPSGDTASQKTSDGERISSKSRVSGDSNDHDVVESSTKNETRRNSGSSSSLPSPAEAAETKNNDNNSNTTSNQWRCACETGFLPPGMLQSLGGAEAVLRMSTGQCYHTKKQI